MSDKTVKVLKSSESGERIFSEIEKQVESKEMTAEDLGTKEALDENESLQNDSMINNLAKFE